MKRMIRLLLLLIILAGIAGGAYVYLLPLVRSDAVTNYAAYTVERGNIATEKCFSASISVASSETHQNTSRATAIREIYVKNGQTVRKGDKLMLLDNGELLKAGLNGTVTEMRFDTTDWLWNNVNLIQISDLTNLKVSLSVDEYDVRNVSAGQKCLVTIVSTGQIFEAEISHVNRVSSSSGQVAYYTASADLTVPENVLPGMTASVSIPSDAAEGVLLLDMAALAFDEEKQPYVLRKTETGYEQVPVTTGLSNGMQVEIISGLNEGETVWAVAGVETARNPFTLTELYKKLVGEKIVVNDMTGSGQDGRNRFPSWQTPGNMNNPAEDGAETQRMPSETRRPDAGGRTRENEKQPFDASGIAGPDAVPQQNAETEKNESESEIKGDAPEAPLHEGERKETP